MKKTLFIKNAFILTVTSLVLRFLGIIFKVWLAAEVGSEKRLPLEGELARSD